jgi:hypothetical protein
MTITELKLAVSDANMAKLGHANTRKQTAKFANLEKRRQKLIENLKLHRIDLFTYQKAIGGTLSTNRRIQNIDPDDLVASDSDDDDDDDAGLPSILGSTRNSIGGPDLRDLRLEGINYFYFLESFLKNFSFGVLDQAVSKNRPNNNNNNNNNNLQKKKILS